MGLFDRFIRKARAVADPVFGDLTYARGEWSGMVQIPTLSEPVAVSIEADDDGPSHAHRAAFQELTVRWVALRPAVADALWQLWRPYLAELNPREHARLSKVSTPELLSESLSLDNVHVDRAGNITLLYGFIPGVGWDDAMFSVSLAGWQPIPLALDD